MWLFKIKYKFYRACVHRKRYRFGNVSPEYALVLIPSLYHLEVLKQYFHFHLRSSGWNISCGHLCTGHYGNGYSYNQKWKLLTLVKMNVRFILFDFIYYYYLLKLLRRGILKYNIFHCVHYIIVFEYSYYNIFNAFIYILIRLYNNVFDIASLKVLKFTVKNNVYLIILLYGMLCVYADIK